MFSSMVSFFLFHVFLYIVNLFRSSQTSATSSQTCPLCREDINSDSGFLLAETPKYDNVKKMLTESILSLPADYKTRSNDGQSMTRSYRE
jgi:hypothetical protein